MSSETINLTPELYHYLQKISLREHKVLKELREETHQLKKSTMQISPEQGQFLALLIEVLNAKKTLDIGVFTGYSALAVALAMPTNGQVIACDVNVEWTSIAKRFWEKAGVANKISLRLAPANETLDQLLAVREAGSFDFAFIDADKANYANYYEKSLILLRQGGIIAVDNVLWGGNVINPAINDVDTQAIRDLNELIAKDERVSVSLLPIGDGLTLARKR